MMIRQRLRNIAQLGSKELRSLLRDPIMLVLIVYAFSFSIYTAATAMPETLHKAPIAVIDPPQHGPERSDPGGMLCQMLVRHGVKAEVSVLARTLPRISDILARHVRDQNADLLVMGAYGHSRLREAILGGATRNMLEQTEIPVLMAH